MKERQRNVNGSFRMKKRQRDSNIQSALSKHNIETGYQILFGKTTTIVTITLFFLRKYRGYRDTETSR